MRATDDVLFSDIQTHQVDTASHSSNNSKVILLNNLLLEVLELTLATNVAY